MPCGEATPSPLVTVHPSSAERRLCGAAKPWSSSNLRHLPKTTPPNSPFYSPQTRSTYLFYEIGEPRGISCSSSVLPRHPLRPYLNVPLALDEKQFFLLWRLSQGQRWRCPAAVESWSDRTVIHHVTLTAGGRVEVKSRDFFSLI